MLLRTLTKARVALTRLLHAEGAARFLARGMAPQRPLGQRSARSEPSPGLVRLAATALIAGALVACGAPAEPRERIVHRLVERAYRGVGAVEPAGLVTVDETAFSGQPGEAARTPRATIGDDTRYVLAGHQEAVVAYRQPFEAGVGEPLTLRVGGGLDDASRLALAVHVGGARRAWRALPPFWRPVERRHGWAAVTLDPAALDPRPGAAELTVRAFRVPEGHRTRYRTREIDFPPAARLDFAFGILEPARGEGPVRFVVEACHELACEPLFEETLDPAGKLGWQERSLSLAPLSGAARSLHFVTEHVGSGAFTLPVWADPTVLGAARGEPMPPNLLLLSIDTLRRDHLGVYGYHRDTAPYLSKRLAPRGVVFDGLIAEAATTDPSHMTMFTSLPAMVHGVECCMKRLDVAVPTLAAELRGHGFQTAAFTENGPLAHERGFSIGFDRWVESKSSDPVSPPGQVERTFGLARDWMSRHGDAPFFLFLHTFQVHAPYEPPSAYDRYFSEPLPHPPDLPSSAAPHVEDTIARYDREIRYVDDRLAELHAWMEERGLNRRTLWVVVSDHGEEFYEHGSLGHGTLPYEEVLRVPLIVVGPGAAAGRREAAPLRHVDLMPTLLELLGVPVPAGLHGRSFAALVRNPGTRSSEKGRATVSASWELPDGFDPPAFAVRVGSHKLIRYRRGPDVREALYDLARDPRERRDLAEAEAAELARLRARLAGYQEAAKAAREEFAGGRTESPAPPRSVPIDPDREEMLRRLGYIE